jgi:hypothetical protein
MFKVVWGSKCNIEKGTFSTSLPQEFSKTQSTYVSSLRPRNGALSGPQKPTEQIFISTDKCLSYICKLIIDDKRDAVFWFWCLDVLASAMHVLNHRATAQPSWTSYMNMFKTHLTIPPCIIV